MKIYFFNKEVYVLMLFNRLYLILCATCYSESTVVCSVVTIKRLKDASAARARGVLMVKILNKNSLSIFAYNLLLDRPRSICISTVIFPYNGLHEIEIQSF